MYRAVLFIYAIAFLLSPAEGQQLTGDPQKIIEDLIEELATMTDLETDYSILYDDLLLLQDNPLNINKADYSDLKRLQFLNDLQILNLIMYIRQNGPLLTIYELQLVDGFNAELVRMLLPFITIGEPVEEGKDKIIPSIRYGRHQLIIRADQILEEQKGYKPISDSAYLANPNSRYLGSPVKLVTRYRYHYKDRIYWGLTAEKDAGEEFFSGSNNYGFDFYSGHLVINDIGFIRTFAAGDYHLRFGQGLTLWSGISYGKTPYALNIKKRQYGITRYGSTDENRFFRGAGTTLRIRDFDLTAFYSGKKIDANIGLVDTITNDIENITSFQFTGYHSIPSEVEDEDAVSESVFGGNISYNRDKFHIGMTAVNYHFSEELIHDDTPYRSFDFSGNSNTNIGMDYQVGLNNFNLFGEISHSWNHGIAYLNGMLLKMHSRISLSLLYRNYERDYFPFYSQAISENSSNKNEQGIYIGTEIRPARHFKISAYFDSFRFPWLKYNVDAPSDGTDYMVRIDYNPLETVEMYLSMKEESKPENETTDSPALNEIVDTDLMKIRYNLSYWVSKNLRLVSRFELSRFKKGLHPVRKGYLIYQDLLFRPSDIPLSVSFRYCMFDTDSYDARIYTYEHDLLYAFSIPAFHSRGIRSYLLVKYSPLEYLDLWFRLAQTYYSDKETIGTGLNEINGNKKTGLKVQMQLKF
ncbi:MAG: helix-hairpin-helix domain-containing protein [Bacteroidales bacterium]|nr:MAG: helix-hairpin-helix domain-containing protein [Bacteroidales bacterium]